MKTDHSFPLISGHLSFDLVNTEIVRHGTRYDLLNSEEDVINWVMVLLDQNYLHQLQLSPDIETWAAESLPKLKKVRSFLREGYERMADGEGLPSRWVKHLEDLTEKAPLAYQVINGELLPVPVGKPVDALISLIALDALNLFATGKLKSVHRCANPACVLLFMNTSGRRKWCSMKICGNREKVSRHQHRKKKTSRK